MKKIFIIVCSCMLLTACGNSSKTNKTAETTDSTAIGNPDMHNAENSLDYDGTYEGVFPAADCPGIEITLTLNADKTFTQHSSYIDRNTSFDEQGTYTVEDNLLTLKEKGGDISYYKLGENHLRKLNAEKEEATGELANEYILNKK